MNEILFSIVPIIIVVFIIIILQRRSYASTKQKIIAFEHVFPKPERDEKCFNNEERQRVQEIKEKIAELEEALENSRGSKKKEMLLRELKEYKSQLEQIRAGIYLDKDDHGTVTSIRSYHSNPVFSLILQTISHYLENNKGMVSDYHIIHDIVDRNDDSLEDEINSQIPVPLYYGLLGTMLGILLGVGLLVVTGGLADLMQGGETNGGSTGIGVLLGGVALAMLASANGLWKTTRSSSKAKLAKIESERRKNSFLSWIQAQLLPQLSMDTSSSLQKLGENLSHFNEAFSSNTTNLEETLKAVNTASQGQAELIQKIDNLNIERITSANIDVYEKLKGSTAEIGQFSEYLQSINTYMADVRALTMKLSESDNRVKAIEEMAAFFKEERGNLDSMKALIAKVVAETNEHYTKSLNELSASTAQQVSLYTKNLNDQYDLFTSAVNGQRKQLEEAIANTQKRIGDALDGQVVALQGGTPRDNNEIKSIKSILDDVRVQNEKTIALLSEIKSLGSKMIPTEDGQKKNGGGKFTVANVLYYIALSGCTLAIICMAIKIIWGA